MVKEDVVGHVKKMEPIFLDGIQSLIDEHPSVKQVPKDYLDEC